jgi:hypothetical protein
VGPIAVLDAVVKRKIPSPRQESNPRNPIVQPVSPALNVATLDTCYMALLSFQCQCLKTQEREKIVIEILNFYLNQIS